MSVDRENERISLSIKLLSGDPWSDSVAKFKVGDQVDATVTKLANFGVFVEIEKGLQGMIHISELSDERVMHPENVVKVGDVVKAEITTIDPKERKVSLSIKALKKREENENLSNYKAAQGSSKTSFGDTLNPEIAAKLAALRGNNEGEEK